MKGTFTYDLVAFFRVLYRRRGFIVSGTAIVALLSIIVSLFWPETWRADTKILVTTPKFKEELQLVPKPFDVKTYQGLLSSDSVYQEVLATLRWYHQAVDTLTQQEALERIRAHLGSLGANWSPPQLIEGTNLQLMTELLYPNGETPSQINQERIYQLGHLDDMEIKTLAEMPQKQLAELSVFDLRRSLRSHVEIIKETNLETVYSNLIQVSARFNSAPGAKLLCNTWIAVFSRFAENRVENEIDAKIQFIENATKGLRSQLDEVRQQMAQFKSANPLDKLRSEMVSKLVTLYGVVPTHDQVKQKRDEFDYTDEFDPFLTEFRTQHNITSFNITPHYQDALLPTQHRLERKLATLRSQLETTSSEARRSEIQQKLAEMQSQHSAVKGQISALTTELNKQSAELEFQKIELESLQNQHRQLESALQSKQALLNEAQLLKNRNPNDRYADISPGKALAPDRREWPKRSLMVIASTVIGFLLFCGLAFFLDFWSDVTRPESSDESFSTG